MQSTAFAFPDFLMNTPWKVLLYQGQFDARDGVTSNDDASERPFLLILSASSHDF
jgi:hypothetical protein